MLNDDYIEEIAQILADMHLVIDRANERLAEPLPEIKLGQPVLTLKNSVISPYAINMMDIFEGERRLGLVKFERTGPSAAQIMVRVGNEQRHSPHFSLDKPEVAKEYFVLVIQDFFPNYLISI